MRSLIDMVEKYLGEHPAMAGVTVEAFGDTFEIPENIPYVNILPRSKPRDRIFLIGGDPVYNVSPEITIEVWEVSAESLRDAFEKCERLAENMLTALANLTATNLGVIVHEEQIEEFMADHWELSFYYMATILMKARMDE